MKQAIIVAKEIKRLKEAINKSASEKLITDYSKKIRSLIKDLKEYCGYKKLNYEKIMKEV